MKCKKFIFVLFSLIIFSCSHENNPIKTDNNPVDTISDIKGYFTKQDFPLKVGNWWRYQSVETIGGYKDTLTVKIFSVNEVNDDSCFFCRVFSNEDGQVDSTQFIKNDTSLYFKTFDSEGYSYFPEFIIKFPLIAHKNWMLNDKWPGVFPKDTFGFSYAGKYLILGKEYDSTFYINRTAQGYRNLLEIQSFQVTHNVGVIHQVVKITSQYINQWQDFYLIDYHLE